MMTKAQIVIEGLNDFQPQIKVIVKGMTFEVENEQYMLSLLKKASGCDAWIETEVQRRLEQEREKDNTCLNEIIATLAKHNKIL